MNDVQRIMQAVNELIGIQITGTIIGPSIAETANGDDLEAPLAALRERFRRDGTDEDGWPPALALVLLDRRHQVRFGDLMARLMVSGRHPMCPNCGSPSRAAHLRVGDADCTHPWHDTTPARSTDDAQEDFERVVGFLSGQGISFRTGDGELLSVEGHTLRELAEVYGHEHGTHPAAAELGDRLRALLEVNGIVDDPVVRPVRDYDGWTFGDRVRVLEDDDEAGLSEGEEGVLVLEKVGAPEFNSERVAVSILIDGESSTREVDPGIIEGV